ncbi:MAG: hypothetical protein IKK21_06915, partial [Clostridia bacterium]|nr:hypothetical protein [Clostridia bacterium]
MHQTEQALTISLNGSWTLHYGPVGQTAPDAFRSLPSLPCTVPGAVHTAFIDAGIIPEPLTDRGDESCRWLEDKEFWFCRRFDIEPDQLRQQMQLTLNGLDATADVWLNGAFLGHCSNAFIPHYFNVTQHLQVGPNELIVRLDQGLAEV